MLQLLSYEKRLLAFFVVQSREEQCSIMQQAKADMKTSGPLIMAYRLIMDNIC